MTDEDKINHLKFLHKVRDDGSVEPNETAQIVEQKIIDRVVQMSISPGTDCSCLD